MSEEARYVQGERIPFALDDAGNTAVALRYGAASVPMSLSDGVWRAEVDTSGLSGRFRWAVLADGRAMAEGVFYVRPLVSKYAAYVEAIDAAMVKVATNGKYSVSVGDLSLTDKTYEEMAKWRAHFADLAAREECGEETAAASGPQFTTGVYYGSL